MDKNTLHSLIDRYIDGTASKGERLLLDEYADQLANMGTMAMSAEEKTLLKTEMHRNILAQLGESEAKVIPLYRRGLFKGIAAAVILLIVTGGVYFRYFQKESDRSTANGTQLKPLDITPGKNGAVLTLADGSIVILDSTGNGVLANQGSTKVVKLS